MHRRAFLNKGPGHRRCCGRNVAIEPGRLGRRGNAGKQAVFKLCSQEWILRGGSVKEKAEKILKWGGCGLEFHGIDVRRAEQIKKELEGTGVSPAALCYGSHGGDYLPLDLAKRRKARADFKRVLDAAAALGLTGVVWGRASTANPS